MKKVSALLVFFLILSIVAEAQQPAFITDSLESYIARGMKDWNIPGLAIAVVKDGKAVVMKGFGVTDVKSKKPVTENTLFMIASNSKLFTGTSLANLDYEKKLSLDDHIRKYFPDYSLYDSTTASEVTIKDMLSHHLGTKTFQGDFTFWNSRLKRREIMEKMKFLKPAGSFRKDFGYCNSCFLTAGEIIPVVTGERWEEYVDQHFLTPLQMTNTYSLGRGIQKRKDVAKPYTTAFTGELTELDYDQVDNFAPAASLVSNVKDLSNWLRFQLDSGRFQGRQIIPWEAVKKTREENTVVSNRASSIYPITHIGYGLGVFEADYNGKKVFWHTGGADGFVSNTCFVPEAKLGITILTNNDNQGFFEALRYQILDAYLNVPFVNRSQQRLKSFREEDQQTIQTVRELRARVNGNRPDLPLKAYSGIYENPLYGPIVIKPEGKDLMIKFSGHKNLTGTLQYLDHDEWLLSYSNAAYGIFPLKFKIQDHRVIATDIKVSDNLEYDPYTFTKKR